MWLRLELNTEEKKPQEVFPLVNNKWRTYMHILARKPYRFHGILKKKAPHIMQSVGV